MMNAAGSLFALLYKLETASISTQRGALYEKSYKLFCIRADRRSILKQIRHNAFTANEQYKQKLFLVIVNNYAVLKTKKEKAYRHIAQ